MVMQQAGIGAACAAAAVVATIAGVWLQRRPRRRGDGGPRLANVDVATAAPGFRRLRRRYRALLGAEALAAAGIALAAVGLVMRPAEEQKVEETRRSRDIMLCLDVSGSMTELDADLVDIFGEVAAHLEGDRIGFTIWNSSPVALFPLTDDYEFVAGLLDEAGVALRESDFDFLAGTNEAEGSSMIGDGLASCVLRFDRIDEDRARSIILATDNQVADGNPIMSLVEAGEYAAGRGIRVYAIAPDDYSFGGEQGQELIELAAVAESTGGAMYEMNDDASVDEVVARIDEREGTDLDVPPTISLHDQPAPLVAVGLGAVLASLAVALVVRR